MAEQLTRAQITKSAVILAEPPAAVCKISVDRTFELPKGLYLATIGLYLGFITVLAVSFAAPAMIIPVAICMLIVIAGFGVPTIWTRLAPAAVVRSKSWARFRQQGIMTIYGRTSARDATVQVLILPVLIFVWGVIVATIVALV